jgi:hypothetical protein
MLKIHGLNPDISTATKFMTTSKESNDLMTQRGVAMCRATSFTAFEMSRVNLVPKKHCKNFTGHRFQYRFQVWHVYLGQHVQAEQLARLPIPQRHYDGVQNNSLNVP